MGADVYAEWFGFKMMKKKGTVFVTESERDNAEFVRDCLSAESLASLWQRGRGVELRELCRLAGLPTGGTNFIKSVRLLKWFRGCEL